LKPLVFELKAWPGDGKERAEIAKPVPKTHSAPILIQLGIAKSRYFFFTLLCLGKPQKKFEFKKGGNSEGFSGKLRVRFIFLAKIFSGDWGEIVIFQAPAQNLGTRINFLLFTPKKISPPWQKRG